MSSKERPRVSVVILNWNTGNETIECLESLYQIDYDRFETIIVDNDSSDDSIDIIRSYAAGKIEIDPKFSTYFPENKPLPFTEYAINEAERRERDEDPFDGQVTLIKNDTNDGFPGGCNIGMRYAMKADTDYILLLNNDTVVDDVFLSKLVEVAESDPSVGMVGSLIYDYEDAQWIQSAGGEMQWWFADPRNYDGIDRGQYNEVEDRDFVWGTSHLIRADLIEELGYLDTYFFHGIEEYDYCARIKRAGYRIVLQPDSKIWHKGGKSLEKVDEHPTAKELIESRQGIFQYKYYYRLLKKHYPPVIFLIPFILRNIYYLYNHAKYTTKRYVSSIVK